MGLLEAEWNTYVKENDSIYLYGRSRKRKSNDSADYEDMPQLQLKTEVSEIFLDDDDN